MGYIDAVGSPDNPEDIVLLAIPDDLQAPREVPPDIAQEEDTQLLSGNVLPDRVRRLIARRATATVAFLKRKNADTSEADIATQLVAAGFDFALERYADRLRQVPELATWHKRRREGGEQGRKKLSAKAASRAEEAQRMLDQGHDMRDIALHFRVDRSTVYRWLNKPANGNGQTQEP
jgi:DNA-binding NarL/FixJ family response regulator